MPDTVGFATKPQLAIRLIETAVAAGLPCRWVAGDEAYGGDPAWPPGCAGYDSATSWPWPARIGDHRPRRRPRRRARRRPPATAWQRVSAGSGAKGHRYYDWAFIALPHATDEHGGHHWLLIRRNRTTGELAFYRCWSPEPVPLHHLVAVAGRRWTIEESFQATKTGLGLDQHQHRRWTSWHRWTTLVIVAHAFLAAATAGHAATQPGRADRDHRQRTTSPVPRPDHRPGTAAADVIAWSLFRRSHQAAAKTSHYARQALTEP